LVLATALCYTVRKAARVRVGYHGPPLTNKSVNTE
jgi:hypothetical protein